MAAAQRRGLARCGSLLDGIIVRWREGLRRSLCNYINAHCTALHIRSWCMDTYCNNNMNNNHAAAWLGRWGTGQLMLMGVSSLLLPPRRFDRHTKRHARW